jgi:CubicO group peptidase (beta-lactamase class C family)
VHPTDDELSQWIDAHVAGYGRTWGEGYAASGYVLVARHGIPIFQRAYGLANRTTGVAPVPNTRFRIGSVTKQMTAAAVLQLVEAWKLALDDPFRNVVPEYPAARGDGISIENLLTHTSGIPNFTEEPDDRTWCATRRTNSELIARMKDKPALFAPGSAFRYSNTNYYLLAMILERLSGLSYDAYLRTHLFGPAGMKHSSASEGEDFDGGNDADAVGYKVAKDDTLVPADPIHLSVPFGAGGVRSSAHDLMLWQRALHTTTTLLTEASRARMLTPVKDGYAFGIGRGVVDGQTIYAHAGGIFGFGSFLGRIEDLATDVIVLFNTEAIFVDVVASSIRKMIVHGAPVPPRHERPAFPVDRATLDAVAGDYLATSEGRETLAKAFSPALAERTSHLALRAEGARLLFDVHMGEPIPLFLGEDGSLFTKGNGVVVTLARDPSGRVHAVTATQNGVFVVPYAR